MFKKTIFPQTRTFPQVPSDAFLYRNPKRPSEVDRKHEHIAGIGVIRNVSNYRLSFVHIAITFWINTSYLECKMWANL